MYDVFTKLDEGAFLYLASCNDLKQAARLVEELSIDWPHEYVVRDLMGNRVNLDE